MCLGYIMLCNFYSCFLPLGEAQISDIIFDKGKDNELVNIETVQKAARWAIEGATELLEW